MIHVYKSGGKWRSKGKEYTIKAIDQNDKQKFIDDGWVLSLDEVKEPEVKETKKSKPKAKVNEDDNKK